MAKAVMLSEQERLFIIMFSERHEGTRIELKRMDKAIDVIDVDDISSFIRVASGGAGIKVADDVEISDVEEEFVFEDEPFKTLKTFLESQTIPYSRRKDHIGRSLMKVMDKFDKPRDVDIGKNKG